jgi:hypothetical protein
MGSSIRDIQDCDFCGRSERELILCDPEGQPVLELDADGLWVCRECRARMTSQPVGALEEGELDERLKPLVGKSAGAICLTLNLPDEPPYQEIIDAASRIAYDEDRFMSTWSFVTQWLDGTTVWQSEDRSRRALVSTDGMVEIQVRG